MDDFAQKAREVADRLRSLFPATPLHLSPDLSARHGAEIWLKREDLSPVRSYKIRGAFNAMRTAREADPGQDLFVAASAGNHAQGVAYACAEFGVRGVIFMPVTTPKQKVERTAKFGGAAVEIRLTGDYFDETLRQAQAFCAETGGHFLAPFDDPDVIEGQASVAAEILDEMETPPDVVVLPVGGGGLSAGMIRYFRTASPETQFFLVEPAGGASLTAARAVGEPTTLKTVDSFVDGASVARIGARPFEILRDLDPKRILLAPENRICTTILTMLNGEGIVLEPAGALAIDALGDIPDLAGKRVVCVTSGGNFDFERLPEVRERAQKYLGLKKYFVLRMPQRPGALKDFLHILGPDDDIARFEYLKKSARNYGSVLLGIETSRPENFTRLLAALGETDFTYRDITDDPTLADLLI